MKKSHLSLYKKNTEQTSMLAKTEMPDCILVTCTFTVITNDRFRIDSQMPVFLEEKL